MASMTQTCVPVNAAKLAKLGDARALLAIPDVRIRLESRCDRRHYGDDHFVPYSLHISGDDRRALVATVPAARAIIEARDARREARRIADEARVGKADRYAQLLGRANRSSRDEIRSMLSQARPKATTGRQLLAIPEARADIPRLIAGKKSERADLHQTLATDWGTRKAIAAAKAIMSDRLARREARKVAHDARDGEPGRVAKKARERLKARLVSLVAPIYQRPYRAPSCGRTTVVGIGEPSARMEASEGWKDYKGHGRRKGITDATATIRVPADWERSVLARGLAEIDGLMTLSAEPVAGVPDGFEVFRATWVRQSRGVSIETESGCIARHVASGTTYHSAKSDHKAAVTGLRRKLTAQAIPADARAARASAAAARRTAARAAQLARLVDRVAAWDFAEIKHVTVSRADSIRAGNCEAGTDQFIDRFFPDRTEDRATIGEIAARVGRMDPALLRGTDLTLARQLAAACLQAIRKDKAARRLVMA